MKTWIITYYKYQNYIKTKKIKAKTATDAIKKANIKNIIDLEIIK